MLDSGAMSNFISQQFIETYNIPLKRKARLILLLVIDSTLISTKAIIHQIVTCNLMLGLADKHQEILILDTILIVTYNVILGMLQLNMHTLQIYWSKRKLVFASGYSHSALATITITLEGIWIAMTMEEELVKELLEVYKNYIYLFAKEETNELLQYWP